MSITPPSLRIFGNIVSQPTRAVLWALAIKQVPHTVVPTFPLKGDCDRPEYLSRFPTGVIPALEDEQQQGVLNDEGSGNRNKLLYLSEANALLTYLAEKHAWHDWYPSPYTTTQSGGVMASTSSSAMIIVHRWAEINKWLHWHHTNVRAVTFKKLYLPVRRAVAKAETTPLTSEDLCLVRESLRSGQHDVAEALKLVAESSFKHHPFLVRGESPSLADITLYCELEPLLLCGPSYYDMKAHPEVLEWSQRMKALPLHDSVRPAWFDVAGRMKAVAEAASNV